MSRGAERQAPAKIFGQKSTRMAVPELRLRGLETDYSAAMSSGMPPVLRSVKVRKSSLNLRHKTRLDLSGHNRNTCCGRRAPEVKVGRCQGQVCRVVVRPCFCAMVGNSRTSIGILPLITGK